MTKLGRLALGLTALSVVACGGEERDTLDVDALGQRQNPIIGGSPDNSRDAVVMLFSQQSGCSGTIIAVQGGSAYVLTAAHCFGPGAIQQVVIADDWQSSNVQVMNVTDYEIHPDYGQSQNNLVYDFAMIEAGPAGPSTPVIPVLRPEQDDMFAGSELVHVGYGLTENGQTSQRHQVDGEVTQLAGIQIAYDQPNGGPCSGDSGGPNLYDPGVGERVAGVTSYGDENCVQVGVSGRASAVYDEFIVPFIGTDPTGSSTATTATTTTTTATTGGVGGGGVTSASGAGVGGAGGGTVAADPNEEWAAGVPARDYNGTLLSSGCSVSRTPSGDRDVAGLAWLGVLGLALGLGRRRPPKRA